MLEERIFLKTTSCCDGKLHKQAASSWRAAVLHAAADARSASTAVLREGIRAKENVKISKADILARYKQIQRSSRPWWARPGYRSDAQKWTDHAVWGIVLLARGPGDLTRSTARVHVMWGAQLGRMSCGTARTAAGASAATCSLHVTAAQLQ